MAPHRDFGIAIKVRIAVASAAEPVGMRNPAILYGVGNILENAVDFAREQVEVNAWWNADTIVISISDDGPGHSAGPAEADRRALSVAPAQRRRQANTAGSASACSSPARCWSAPAPR